VQVVREWGRDVGAHTCVAGMQELEGGNRGELACSRLLGGMEGGGLDEGTGEEEKWERGADG